MQRFELYISYCQLAVFWPNLDEPFNSWTDEEVQAGYSWSPKSVSFKTPIDAGTCWIEVVQSRDAAKAASGAIEVPFTVPAEGRVEMASISDSYLVDLPSGDVVLRYEPVEDGLLRLTFVYAEP